MDARPWDFQTEECTLRACVDRFNNRRYLSQQSNVLNRATIINNTTANLSNVAAGSSVGFANPTLMSGGNITCPSNSAFGPSSTIGAANLNANISQQQIIINDVNDQYDPNYILDVNVNNFLSNGDSDKYNVGFGGWEYDQVKLSDEFKQHYELWLQLEVYNMSINWDSLQTNIGLMAINK